ncbi:Two-component response regulator 24 [Linum perenne]
MDEDKKNKIKKKMKMIRALVVDDDSTNRMIHQKMLEKVGIVDKLEVASNGKEAVEIVAALGFDYFHLILMDMDMPVMNGIQATKKLRGMGIRSVIAGVSSRSVEGEIREFIDAGLDDYHQKPLTNAKLLSILHKLDDSCS